MKTSRTQQGLLLIYGSSIWNCANTWNQKGLSMGKGFERLIVEKPFGTDLKTASQLSKNWKKPLMRNKSSELTLTAAKKCPNIFVFVSRLSHFWQPLEPRLYWQYPLPLLNAWVLKNAVALLWSLRGPFGIWCKTTLFSFCLCCHG